MKILKISGHIYFLIIFLLAIFFYHERTLYIDPACQLFNMINTKNFVIFDGRYSMAINQMLPLLALKLHMSLKVILISYSISFILIYYACFLLCLYVFKNINAALGIVFIVVGIRSMFIHSISETWLGLCYSTLFYAIINYKFSFERNWKNNLVFFFLSFLMVVVNYFIHPTTMFPLLFLLAYTVIDKKDFKNYRYYVILAFILAIYLFKFFTKSNPHEDMFFSELKNYRQNLPHLFSSYTTRFFFVYRIVPIYMYIIIPLIILLITQFRRRDYLKFFLQIAGVFTLLLITILAFFKGDSEIAMESRFLPMTTFVFIPFLSEILLRQGWEKLKYIAGLFLVCTGLVGILIGYIPYHKRTKALEDMIWQSKDYQGTKFVCDIKNCPQADALKVKWGVAIESLLTSSIQSPDSARTIYLADNMEELWPQIYTETKFFLYAPWWIYWEDKDLNHDYFRLKPDVYRKIPAFKLQDE